MYADGSIAPTPELGEVRNVAPKTRSERLSQLYKEDLEKSRLRARREGYYRHEEAGITQPEGSLGSISDADRFVTDVAAVNKNERDAAIAKQEQMYYAKRLNNADREEKRWRTIEMEDPSWQFVSAYTNGTCLQCRTQSPSSRGACPQSTRPTNPGRCSLDTEMCHKLCGDQPKIMINFF